MKLAIVALVLAVSLIQTTNAQYGYGLYSGLYGYGYGYGLLGKKSAAEMPPTKKEQILPVLNRTECLYTKDTSMLSCHGSSGIVECETELKWTKPVEFQLYGIGKYEGGLVDIKYRILPRKLDNSAWLNNVVLDNGVERLISLYHSDKIEDFGLKIKDEICFKEIVDLFTKSIRNEKVYLKSDLAVKQVAYIIGDLMVSTELPKIVKNELLKIRETDLVEKIDELKSILKDEYDEAHLKREELLEKLNKLKRSIDMDEDMEHSTMKRRSSEWKESRPMRDAWNPEESL